MAQVNKYYIKFIFNLCLLFFSLTLTAYTKNDSVTAHQLNLIAYQKLILGLYKESYQISLQAKSLAEIESNNQELARSLSNLASNMVYIGETVTALKLYNQSLEIARKMQDYPGIDRAINNIASIYNQISNFDEALKYRQEQFRLSEDIGTEEEKLTALMGLTESYINLKNLTQAKYFQAQAKKILLNNPNPFLNVYLLFSEATIYENDLNINAAINSLIESLNISQKHTFTGLEVSIRANIAELYFKSSRLTESETESLKSLKVATELQLKAKELQNHQLLSRIYTIKNDYKQALNHTNLANDIQLKISGEKVRQLAEITKIDRKMAETEEQLIHSQQMQKISQLELEKHKQLLIVWSIIFVFLIVFIFFWFYHRASKKELVRHKALNQELKDLDKLKDRILTNTSHELRTPLNGIIGLSQIILAEHQSKLEPEIQQSIQLIEKSGLQLSEIINDILDLARLRAHKMSFNYQLFDLNILINDVLALCKPLSKNTNVKIIFESNQDQLELHQDKKRLQQILFNLIGNSIKFTTSGTIIIDCKLNRNLISISITDTGIGIPHDKIERIFEGFEQVDSNNNRLNSGTGLGLAICRELINALGGDIKIESRLGEGTFVSINLPNVRAV